MASHPYSPHFFTLAPSTRTNDGQHTTLADFTFRCLPAQRAHPPILSQPCHTAAGYPPRSLASWVRLASTPMEVFLFCLHPHALLELGL
eukprot:scaffold16057_cov156-Cylindrotheca_fusiformis.AAC.1